MTIWKNREDNLCGETGNLSGTDGAAILQREHLNFPVEILARGIVVLFPEPLNQKAEAVMISNGITLENYMSSQLESSDLGNIRLVLTFDQAAKEKVLEMEGAQNVEVLTELTGDEPGNSGSVWGRAGDLWYLL